MIRVRLGPVPVPEGLFSIRFVRRFGDAWNSGIRGFADQLIRGLEDSGIQGPRVPGLRLRPVRGLGFRVSGYDAGFQFRSKGECFG